MTAGRRRWVTALAAAVAAVVLGGLGAPTQAVAVGDGESYDSRMCRSWTSNPAQESWTVDRLQPERVWPRTRGEGVTIAVLDTGVDLHDVPMLADANVTTVNFAGFESRDDNEGMDDCAHGTAVVSLIVGQPDTDSAHNLTGIAPDAEVIAMRTLQVSGSQDEEEAAVEPLEPTVTAIHDAIRRDVDIISISQQGSDTPEYRAAVAEAIAKDIVVIAAAGNRGGDTALPYPAAYPGVISVGMSGPDDMPHEMSQWHEDLAVSVAAPGVEVYVARPSGADTGPAYASETGTSFAVPQVTGTVALMLSENPDLTVAEVKHRLEMTADPPPMAVPDQQLGYGIVNPLRAVTGVVPGSDETPAPAPEGTPAPDPDSLGNIDRTTGYIAIGIGGVGVVAVTIALVVRLALPAGRRRRWRPAQDA